MGHLRKHPIPNRKLSNKFGIFPITLVLCSMLAAVCLSSPPVNAAMEIADEPMMARIKAAPANIMIVLDDSGSMTFEILVEGQKDGRYPSPIDPTSDKSKGFCYIFDYMGDNAYEWDDSDDRDEKDNLRYMLEEYRTYWKSQFYGVNVMYYNPGSSYGPWPDYAGQSFSNANINTPAPDPVKTSGLTNLDLDATSFTIVKEGGPNLDVKHAHYFMQDISNDVWLVVLDGGQAKILY